MSAEQKMKTCKECKVEKCINEFAINRKVGTKIYYKAYCRICWCERQKSKYVKKNNSVKNNKKLINKITDMRNDGEKWDSISDNIGYTCRHIHNLRSLDIIPC